MATPIRRPAWSGRGIARGGPARTDARRRDPGGLPPSAAAAEGTRPRSRLERAPLWKRFTGIAVAALGVAATVLALSAPAERPGLSTDA